MEIGNVLRYQRWDDAPCLNAKVLSDLVQRARAGFKAVYGPDSTQYEQSGAVRRSERSSGLHRVTKEKPVGST